MVAFVLFCVGAGASTAAEIAVATADSVKILAVRFGGDASATRLVVDLNGPISSSVSLPSAGETSVSVDLSAAVAADQRSGAGRGAVKAWRLRDGPLGVRLFLDLTDRARIVRRFVLPPAVDGAAYRLVIDVAKPADTPPTAVAEARSARDSVEAPAVRGRFAPVRSARATKVIVIDAGHGGHDPGAQSAAHDEKDVTLAAAVSLKKRLEQSGRYRVVLTRGTDVYIPLDARVKIARKVGADLFISLHADSAGSDPSTHGASIYTLSDHGEARVNTVLGQHEWFNRAGKRSDPAVGQILLDLTQNSTRNRSSIFAGLLVEHLSDRVDLLARTRRDAGYFVLLAPDVPATLLEMGFISNLADEARLTDAAQRRRLMDGVAAAIDDYFTGPTVVASR